MRFRFPKIGNLWLPTDDDPFARFYRSDAGVTSSGSATRRRVGVRCQATGVKAFDAAPIGTDADEPLDGQGFAELPSGRFLLAGGAPTGHLVNRVNTIWKSDDRGKTWSVLLADGSPSATRPARAHTWGFFTATFGGTPYVYWLGGDPGAPTGDVFRIPASALDVGGNPSTPWTRLTQTCPTSGLVLFMYGVLDGDIYIIGGQTSIADGSPASKEVYVSTNEGVTWTNTGLDCPADVWGQQLGPLPVKDGKFWICGSGRYDDTPGAFDLSNAVYTFDGSAWDEVLAEGHSEFPRHRYHSVVLFNDRLWTFNGTTYDGVATLTSDTLSLHHSADGVTWTEWTDPLPWGGTHAQAVLATDDGIYLTEGFQSDELYVIREHTGALVSAWADQGEDGLDLLQATDGEKPIYDPLEFDGRGGLVFTLGQFLALASKDAELGDGFFEVWIVAKSITFDTSAEQGTNPPCMFVGATDGSSWNNFGLMGDGALQYIQVSGGYQSDGIRGTGYNDDQPRLFGIVHQANSLKFYVGAAQVGSTDTTNVGFDATHTGWDAIGAGYLEADKAEMVVGALLVRTTGVPSDVAFISNLNTWASRWGTT